MSAAAAEVFDRSPYQAPEADLRNTSELVPDRLFSIEGRVGVMRYNARLTQAIIVMAIGGLMLLGAFMADSGLAIAVALIPASVLMIGGIAVMLYTAVKRLHDLGHSGWFYLIGLIPLVGALWVLCSNVLDTDDR